MTIEEYINQKLQAFGITEAQMTDVAISTGLDLKTEYTSDNQAEVGKAMCDMIVELCFAPYQRSVSEGGFSMSWDTSKLGQYYLFLCRKWGVKPNTDTMASLEVSAIIDRTNSW